MSRKRRQRNKADAEPASATEAAIDRSSALAPAPRAFVAALQRAGIRLRVSYEQPDGVTPIYIAAPVEDVRPFVPEGAEVSGSAVHFGEDWVIAFCDSDNV